MVRDAEALNRAIHDYVSEVKRLIIIDKVILFGSYAAGTATEHSDIDLCFFSPDFLNRRSIDISMDLLRIARKYRMINFEPRGYATSEINGSNPLVMEIIRTGIEL